MEAKFESNKDRFDEIWNRITPTLLVPKLFLERSWALSGGSVNHYLYLARPFPKFRLGALHRSMREYLAQYGVSEEDRTTVGGKYHKYETKPVLELKKFKINPIFLKGKAKDVYSQRLTFRAAWANFTAVFWVRAVCITVFKNYKLEDPANFLSSLLTNTLNYPKFVVSEAIEKRKIEYVLKEHEQVRINDKRGWRIEL